MFSNVNMEFQVTEVVYFPFSDQNALVCNLSNIKLDSDVLDLNVFTKVVISRPLNHVNINNFKDEQGNFYWGCLIGRYHNLSANFMFEKLFSVTCMLFERCIPKRECRPKVNSSLTKQNKFKSQRDWYTPELGGLKNKVLWYLEVHTVFRQCETDNARLAYNRANKEYK